MVERDLQFGDRVEEVDCSGHAFRVVALIRRLNAVSKTTMPIAEARWRLLKQLEKEVECGETIEEPKTGSVPGAR